MPFTPKSFKGSIPALITPMKDGAVDEAAFRRLVRWQIAQGSDGLVPCGTTGESPTLSHAEHMRVIDITLEETDGRIPVIAGAGSNSTAEAISLTRHAKEMGADAVLSVTGYYNKPSQEGIYRHYAAIAEAVDIPIILYNIPARAIVEISVDTMARLSQIPNIIGVRTPPPISPGFCASAPPAVLTGCSCRAKTARRWPTWRRAPKAASR